MVTMKTLREYHEIYQPRPGDSAERFFEYEKFVEKNPHPKPNENYHSWYAKLKEHMESRGFN